MCLPGMMRALNWKKISENWPSKPRLPRLVQLLVPSLRDEFSTVVCMDIMLMTCMRHLSLATTETLFHVALKGVLCVCDSLSSKQSQPVIEIGLTPFASSVVHLLTRCRMIDST